MAAGIASLSKIQNSPKLYEKLENLAKRLVDGFKNAANNAGVALQTDVRGSMFGFFFNENPVKNYDDALKSDTKLYAKFHRKMLEKGVYLAPSQFETGFICDAMSEVDIDFAINAAKEAFLEIKNG